MSTRRVALVTGANRGIGRAIADRMASEGFLVVVAARVLADAVTAADDIGHDAFPVQLDVTDAASVQAAIDSGRVVEETGGDYGDEGFILQEAARLRAFDGNHPICGVWIVAHEACGLGIREDRSRITGNGSRFIPHRF